MLLFSSPPPQEMDNLPMGLSEVNRGFFPFSFLEINVDQYSVTEFSVFLFIR